MRIVKSDPDAPMARLPEVTLTRRQLIVGGAFAGLALAGCARPTPDHWDVFRIGSGPEGAVYREIAEEFARVLRLEWDQQRVEVVQTQAAVENARLLARGEVQAAFVNVDVANEHVADIMAIARVFDSALHIVVPDDSPVRSLRDLEGRVVAAGLEQSGTRFTAVRLLDSVGVQATMRDFSQTDSVGALQNGAVDAVLSLTGTPTPAMSALAQGAGMRLLDVETELSSLIQRYPLEYFAVPIAASVYPGMGAATALAVPTLLACTDLIDADTAYFLTEVLFDRAAELSSVRAEARHINPRMGSSTTPISLHPGAVRWFRDNKP